MKHTNDSHRKGVGKQFWKHSDQQKWTPGKFVATFVITLVASFYDNLDIMPYFSIWPQVKFWEHSSQGSTQSGFLTQNCWLSVHKILPVGSPHSLMSVFSWKKVSPFCWIEIPAQSVNMRCLLSVALFCVLRVGIFRVLWFPYCRWNCSWQ